MTDRLPGEGDCRFESGQAGDPGNGARADPGPAAGRLRGRGMLDALDRAGTWTERPVRRLVGERLDPLPHAGTISVFLLAVVTVTGLYLTLFFAFGYEASYEATADLESHAIGRVVRALHRYASALLVVTVLVHAWRILTAKRFVGRRRHARWFTGVAALMTVWLAGVTGYWLVWDQRAQALSEATASLISRWGWGVTFTLDHLSGLRGSGSTMLLGLWFAHLVLTGIIGWFTYRHLRRTRLAWFPPPVWMALLGGSLVVVSLALPVGMLAPATPDRTLPDLPLDPFVLFLLPPLLSDGRWLILAVFAGIVALVAFLPRLLDSDPPAPVRVIDDACTGCGLCVDDCPYEALSMEPRSTSAGEPRRFLRDERQADRLADHDDERLLAVLDPASCVACGVCLGSCAFDALELPGWPTLSTPLALDADPQATVVVACDRHRSQAGLEASRLAGGSASHRDDAGHDDTGLDTGGAAGVEVVLVPCAGAVAPKILGRAAADGHPVHLIGCAPDDCRYGCGNRLAEGRMSGDRAPHLARRWRADVVEDFVPTGELASALARPGAHGEAEADTWPTDRARLAGPLAVVALSALLVALATRVPTLAAASEAELQFTLDHRPGNEFAELPETVDGEVVFTPSSWDDDAVGIELLVDGESVGTEDLVVTEDRRLAIARWAVGTGEHDWALVIVTGSDERATLVSGASAFSESARVQVTVSDVAPPPGVDEGRDVFTSRAAGCDVCHSVKPGEDLIGPSLAGLADRAGDQVEGLDAEGYIRQSILLPDQYIVEGFPPGQMLPIYRDRLSEDELAALIAYLMTLTEDGG